MKTIVHIISAQLAPNYLFTKEFYEEGDELLLIATKKVEKNLNKLLNSLPNILATCIIFEEEGDEEKWDVMVECINKYLDRNKKYIVNLSGGTKYMSHAIMNIFENFDSHFYYIPFPKNVIIAPKSNDIRPIKYRMGVKEYLGLYEREIKCNSILETEEYTNDIFNLFTNDLFSENDKAIIEILREHYRDRNISNIENVEKGINTSKKFPPIPGLAKFLEFINFPLKDSNKLSKYESRYLTGGWFEEYAYHLIKKTINPNDILLGVEIQRNSDSNINDLDVAFTIGNKLYIIECKTGVGKEGLFKEIVYKASALKSYLAGLSANSYIITLSNHKEEWANISRNLDSTYLGREFFIEEEKWLNECNKIIKYSNDR